MPDSSPIMDTQSEVQLPPPQPPLDPPVAACQNSASVDEPAQHDPRTHTTTSVLRDHSVSTKPAVSQAASQSEPQAEGAVVLAGAEAAMCMIQENGDLSLGSAPIPNEALHGCDLDESQGRDDQPSKADESSLHGSQQGSVARRLSREGREYVAMSNAVKKWPMLSPRSALQKEETLVELSCMPDAHLWQSVLNVSGHPYARMHQWHASTVLLPAPCW